MKQTDQFNVKWVDAGREPQCEPDPRYPEGVDADCSDGAKITCVCLLPYPAPRCGLWLVSCNKCHQNAGITTAGRPDDPRSVCLGCQLN